jgi:putative redox protein
MAGQGKLGVTMRTAIVTTASGKYRQTVRIGPHTLVADEGAAQGGDDAGPEPHEWILAGLGACTSMTVGVYAKRKGWPLEAVEVRVDGAHVGGAFVLTRSVLVKGDLSDEQRARLLEIADKCPVHKSLSGEIRIETTLGPLASSHSAAP